MPPVYPPLVTSDPSAPGIDVELLRALAEKLALKLAITPNPAIGQDFNPRNWRVTRAQCEVLAGGVVALDCAVAISQLECLPGRHKLADDVIGGRDVPTRIVAKVQKKFPDRKADGLAKTCRVQMNRLSKSKEEGGRSLKVKREKQEGTRGLLYSL